ncbi:MAG: HD-GYP domain-containing protein [Burkholderiales bacterium]|nr:HD-GYP domain-containing protein [Burkholderiales bacterium]
MDTSKHPEYMEIEDIYVGLFVHLDLSWMEHDFARSSFKIKSASDIAGIKRLGLNRIRFDPTLSDPRPEPVFKPATAPTKVVEQDLEAIARATAKQERIERLTNQRIAIAECKKQFLNAAKTLKKISLNIFSRPKEVRQDADQLVQQMLESMLENRNIAIHLMNDKTMGEDNYYHSLNVSVLALLLGKELQLPEEAMKILGIGSLFHDIGKIEIPDKVVQKKEPLTHAENNLMQQHCAYGLPIAKKLELPQGAVDIVTQHHECMDGTGYPRGLMRDGISKFARIVAIVNTYDNLCNRPNPDDSLSPYEALSTMFARQRTLFDTEVLNIFIHCMGVYPPGTIVRLSDDSIGMVISVNSGAPLRPSVLIYDPKVPKEEALILDLIGEADINIITSLKPKQLTPEVYDYLSPRKRMMYYFDKPVANNRKA